MCTILYLGQSYSATQRAILRLFLNSFPNESFLASDWNFFGGGGKLGKKEDNLDLEWGLLSVPGDREKRPCTHIWKSNILEQAQ